MVVCEAWRRTGVREKETTEGEGRNLKHQQIAGRPFRTARIWVKLFGQASTETQQTRRHNEIPHMAKYNDTTCMASSTMQMPSHASLMPSNSPATAPLLVQKRRHPLIKLPIRLSHSDIVVPNHQFSSPSPQTSTYESVNILNRHPLT